MEHPEVFLSAHLEKYFTFSVENHTGGQISSMVSEFSVLVLEGTGEGQWPVFSGKMRGHSILNPPLSSAFWG